MGKIWQKIKEWWMPEIYDPTYLKPPPEVNSFCDDVECNPHFNVTYDQHCKAEEMLREWHYLHSGDNKE